MVNHVMYNFLDVKVDSGWRIIYYDRYFDVSVGDFILIDCLMTSLWLPKCPNDSGVLEAFIVRAHTREALRLCRYVHL